MPLDQRGRHISIGNTVKRTRFTGWNAERRITDKELVVTNVRQYSIEFVIDGDIMVAEARNFTVVDKRLKKMVL